MSCPCSTSHANTNLAHNTLANNLMAADYISLLLRPSALRATSYDDAQPVWRSADCGAGVGRVTEQLLLHHFATVDLIEPSQHLIGTARENLSKPGREEHPKGHEVGEFFNMGLQAWTPEAGQVAAFAADVPFLWLWKLSECCDPRKYHMQMKSSISQAQ